MKGYFSSLIKQTGITFGSNNSLKPVSFEASLKGSKGHNETTPIHAEENKLIDAPSDNLVQGFRDDITQHSTGHLNGKGSMEDWGNQGVEKNHEDHRNDYVIKPVKVSEKVDIQQPIEGKGDERFIQEEQRSKVFDSKLHPLSEKLQAQHEINRVEFLERKERMVAGTAAKERTQQSGKLIDSTSEESEKSTPSKFGTRSGDWKATLKEVREWITEASIVNDEGIKVSDAIEAKEEMYAPYYPKPVELHQGREPEIHDFHLSIGTISLTIEAPQDQEKIQSGKPEQKIGRNEISTKENNSSRLNRHYIRI